MDSIADMLIRIQNALKVKKESVDLPHSQMREGLTKILFEEGYIGKYDLMTRLNKKFIRIVLKYVDGKNVVVAGMKRVSRPGRRIYVGADSLPRVQSGFGTAIVSTSKGLMTDEAARAKKIGGEVLCYIW